MSGKEPLSEYSSLWIGITPIRGYVILQISNKGRTNTVYVKTVYERRDWYIDDITHSFNGEEYSIVGIAEMYHHQP